MEILFTPAHKKNAMSIVRHLPLLPKFRVAFGAYGLGRWCLSACKRPASDQHLPCKALHRDMQGNEKQIETGLIQWLHKPFLGVVIPGFIGLPAEEKNKIP